MATQRELHPLKYFFRKSSASGCMLLNIYRSCWMLDCSRWGDLARGFAEFLLFGVDWVCSIGAPLFTLLSRLFDESLIVLTIFVMAVCRDFRRGDLSSRFSAGS